jgi:hypothetical protein
MGATSKESTAAPIAFGFARRETENAVVIASVLCSPAALFSEFILPDLQPV